MKSIILLFMCVMLCSCATNKIEDCRSSLSHVYLESTPPRLMGTTREHVHKIMGAPHSTFESTEKGTNKPLFVEEYRTTKNVTWEAASETYNYYAKRFEPKKRLITSEECIILYIMYYKDGDVVVGWKRRGG